MELRGEATELFTHDTAQPVVLEGGANCSKTFSICAWLAWVAETTPNARILVLRKVRADCIDTVCIKPLELGIIQGHIDAGLVRVLGGESRKRYDFLASGAMIVPGGMDKISRHMGAGWDIIVIFEATEITQEEYEYLSTRTSREPTSTGRKSIIVLDVNPAMDGHWINQLAKRGEIRRLRAKHEDNPMLHDGEGWTENGVEYLTKLARLTGARKRRLLHHEWCAEETAIWAEYARSIHYQSRESWRKAKLVKVVGGFDWGTNDPGALEVFGITEGGHTLRLFELYRRGLGINSWAKRVGEVDDRCREEWGRGLDRLVFSHERPEIRELINDFLHGVGKPRFVEGYKAAPGAIKARIERVRWFLDPGAVMEEGVDIMGPQVSFLSGSDWLGPDTGLQEDMKPLGWDDEVEGYIWAKTREGKRSKEVPDEGCANHACDAVGMGLQAAWDYVRPKVMGRSAPRPEPNRGTQEWSDWADRQLLEGRGRR